MAERLDYLFLEQARAYGYELDKSGRLQSTETENACLSWLGSLVLGLVFIIGFLTILNLTLTTEELDETLILTTQDTFELITTGLALKTQDTEFARTLVYIIHCM